MPFLHTAAQSRAADARAIAEAGCSGFDLMLRAGRFAFDCLLQRWPEAGRILVFCGKGNNAGDGYIVAGYARQTGLDARIVQVGAPPVTGDGALAVAWAAARGVPVGTFNPDVELAEGRPDNTVLIDALLGTGQRGALRPPFDAAVRLLNASALPILAIDVPTGLDADTGGGTGSDETIIRAALTATFITRKLGQFTGIGREVCGTLCFDSLGVPEALCGSGVELLEQLRPLPPLPVNSYKHQRGHVAVCGGDSDMGGAVLMAAEAALRCGAGMVTVITRAEHRPAIIARRPELMVVDASDDESVQALLRRADCVVLGPGLGRRSWGADLFAKVASGAQAVPVLLDADGFYHWPGSSVPLQPAVITPHIAEAARLLGLSPAAVQHDRPAAVRALVRTTGAAAVLKGAGTLIADQVALSLCNAGNPGMATAGMGDVLCGVIAAHLAAGIGSYAAARRGVLVHAVAGDRVAARMNPRSMLATDVIDELRSMP